MRKFTLILLLFVVGCAKVPTMPEQPEISETRGDYQSEQTVPTTQAEAFNITFNFSGAGAMDDSLLIGILAAGIIWEETIIEGLPDVNHPSLGHIDDLLVSIQMDIM